MTAFDRAWTLLKMPLVRDSIEYGKPNYTGFPTATAKFQHRDDPDIRYDMRAFPDHGGTRMSVRNPSGERVGWGYFKTGRGDTPKHTETSDIGVIPGYSRQGIATAMYDLINEMGKTKGAKLRTDPERLSEDSAPLWAKVLGLPYESHANFQREAPRSLYWPEEGVFE
tara:strand:+ start:545 stop:1048 length:504 start_codon:yes stop_codon:yes gene_type:complete